MERQKQFRAHILINPDESFVKAKARSEVIEKVKTGRKEVRK